MWQESVSESFFFYLKTQEKQLEKAPHRSSKPLHCSEDHPGALGTPVCSTKTKKTKGARSPAPSQDSNASFARRSPEGSTETTLPCPTEDPLPPSNSSIFLKREISFVAVRREPSTMGRSFALPFLLQRVIGTGHHWVYCFGV